MARFDGKVALITGGASGIGAETARTFARDGARIVIADTNGDAAQAICSEIKALGGAALAAETDVTRSDDVEAAVAATVERFGGLDILFNSAGIIIEGDVHDLPEEAWDKVMDVNVKGTFLTCRHAIPAMTARGGGAIVNVGSIHSFAADSMSCVYTASKAAVVTLTRNIALRYADRGIRANTICPGDCETPLVHDLFDRTPGMRERITAKYPIGRLAQPADIANAVAFLASDEAGFATGTELAIDGGFLAS